MNLFFFQRLINNLYYYIFRWHSVKSVLIPLLTRTICTPALRGIWSYFRVWVHSQYSPQSWSWQSLKQVRAGTSQVICGQKFLNQARIVKMILLFYEKIQVDNIPTELHGQLVKFLHVGSIFRVRKTRVFRSLQQQMLIGQAFTFKFSI